MHTWKPRETSLSDLFPPYVIRTPRRAGRSLPLSSGDAFTWYNTIHAEALPEGFRAFIFLRNKGILPFSFTLYRLVQSGLEDFVTSELSHAHYGTKEKNFKKKKKKKKKKKRDCSTRVSRMVSHYTTRSRS